MAINLTLTLQSKANCVLEVKQILENLVQNSRKEKGCLQYDLHQSKDDATVFIFHEVWENKAIYDLHNSQQYVTSFFGKASELLIAKPQVIFTDKIA